MKSILIFTAAIVCALGLRAEITADYTVEWLAHEAEIIAFATPISETYEKGPGQVWFTKMEFKIEKLIKGKEYKEETITLYSYGYNEDEKYLTAEKATEPHLIFVSVAKNKFGSINGKFVLTHTHMYKSLFSASTPIQKLYTPEFHRLTDFTELAQRTLKQVQKEQAFLAKHPKAEVAEGHVEIPWDSELHQELWAGSISYLILPEYRVSAN